MVEDRRDVWLGQVVDEGDPSPGDQDGQRGRTGTRDQCSIGKWYEMPLADEAVAEERRTNQADVAELEGVGPLLPLIKRLTDQSE